MIPHCPLHRSIVMRPVPCPIPTFECEGDPDWRNSRIIYRCPIVGCHSVAAGSTKAPTLNSGRHEQGYMRTIQRGEM